MDLPRVHFLKVTLRRFGYGLAQGLIHLVIVRSGREHSGAILLRHVDGAVQEVSQAAGEFLVVGHLKPFLAEVGVIAGGHVAHEVIAQPFWREDVGGVVWIHHVSEAFAHLLAFDVPPAVHDELRHLLIAEAERMKHDRPVDGVRGNEDVFADDMGVGWPQRLEVWHVGIARFIRKIAGETDVVHQRIKPDIVHEALIKRQRDSPTHALDGA